MTIRRGLSIQPSRVLFPARWKVRFYNGGSNLNLLVSQRSRKKRIWWRFPKAYIGNS